MKKQLRALAVMAAVLQAPWALAAPLSLDQALDLAVERSQALRSARVSATSAAEMARAAGQQSDPMLMLGIENLPVTGADRFSTTAEGMTMKRIGITQEWVSSEKRAAREAAATAAAGRESIMERVTAAETRLQTALVYLDAYYAGEALKLSAHSEAHAREELEAGKARQRSPGTSRAEVLALSSALAVAEDDSGDARQLQEAALAGLQRWVGVRADALSPPAVPRLPSEPEYVDAHPVVAARQRDIDVARREADVTRLASRPNWSWEVAYGQRTGMSDLMTVGVTIPLQLTHDAKQGRETTAKLGRIDQAEADLEEARRAAAGEYAALTSDARRLQERIERFRAGVLTAATQRTAVTLAAYRANQASLEMVFQARHAELEAQRKLLTLQRDLAKTQAQLSFKPVEGGAP